MHLSSKIFIYALCLFCLTQNASAEEFCDANLQADTDTVANATAQIVKQDLIQRGFRREDARGYAILIAAMVASAAATTYLAASLPPNFQFLSQFVAQVSTLGVYVLGAPIWEPLSSAFRKLAFGVRSLYPDPIARSGEDLEFEQHWRRTQENFSLNAQMSRNVKTQFIISVQHNFYEAHRAVQAQDIYYAADQIAEAAFRQRRHFRDIKPNDRSIAVKIRSAFTDHLPGNVEMKPLVWERLKAMEGPSLTGWVDGYYTQLLEAWLAQGLTGQPRQRGGNI